MKRNLSLITTALALILLVVPTAKATEKVSSSFLGHYQLIENIEGNCAETLEVKERSGDKYALWLTYRDEENHFLGNEKFSEINTPEKSDTDTCMTAGPVLPFCYETIKELTRYNEKKKLLESFYGRKSNYSKTARYEYSKVEQRDGGLRTTQLRMEKVLPLGVFTMTPVEVGANHRAYNPFLKIKKYIICSYRKK